MKINWRTTMDCPQCKNKTVIPGLKEFWCTFCSWHRNR